MCVCVCLDTPSTHTRFKEKYHSITAAIKARHSSMTQMYQNIKSLTDETG